ncbi:MAG: AAA family ATPase [Candidatus Thiodubiliella endoseptemdiera]|uniref:AAA family ATPase n=1 Tax=Candidatus Thiodubiliella endoseptemdiera TaxID=2738886 RepID=A0A853F9C1_9GAMM|nr:AAA family ATPase [Candidatus Thiodubiliella endoseptemdiera]
MGQDGKTVWLSVIDACKKALANINFICIFGNTVIYWAIVRKNSKICLRYASTQSYKIVYYFDEIQYLPKWEVHLKPLVDSYPAYKFYCQDLQQQHK